METWSNQVRAYRVALNDHVHKEVPEWNQVNNCNDRLIIPQDSPPQSPLFRLIIDLYSVPAYEVGLGNLVIGLIRDCSRGESALAQKSGGGVVEWHTWHA